MNRTAGPVLHRFLILAVSLSCLLVRAPEDLRPADPLCGMDSYPYANSVLDRQCNRFDDGLRTPNKNYGGPPGSGGPSGLSLPHDPARGRSLAARVRSRSVFPVRTCLTYDPLLPIPPPRS